MLKKSVRVTTQYSFSNVDWGVYPNKKLAKIYIEKRKMKISNNFIRRILDSCDLIGILGRILAYLLEFNKTFTTPPHLKISSTQGFEPPYYLKRGVNTELTYPLPKLGEGRVRVHSYIKNLRLFNDNGILPPVQSKIASLRNGGIVMLRLPKPCTSASLFRLHIGLRTGGVECQ